MFAKHRKRTKTLLHAIFSCPGDARERLAFERDSSIPWNFLTVSVLPSHGPFSRAFSETEGSGEEERADTKGGVGGKERTGEGCRGNKEE